jgi:hypothetical protein
VHFAFGPGIFKMILDEGGLDEEREMKSITILVLAMVASVAFGPQVWAQTWASQQDGIAELTSGKNVTLKGSISGTAENAIPGPCTGGTLAFGNQCPTGHTCVCTEISDANFSSTVIGKGKADVFLTIDTSAGYGLPTPGASPSPECFPFVGEIDVIARDTLAFEGNGSVCAAPKNTQLGGALAIGASELFTVGFANFTVNLSESGSFKMTFKGNAQTK